MIESLELRNWRSYTELSLQFDAGVTFIVAPNGVGKSSIIEGARFAVYGIEPRQGGHRKADASGETTASVAVRLEGDGLLRITRSLPQRKKSPVVTADLDGRSITEAELADFLHSRLGGPLTVLDRLSMIHGSDVVGSGEGLDLRSHLSDFLGVSGLDRALAETAALLKEAEAAVKKHRAASDVSRDDVERLRREAQQAREQLTELEPAMTSLEARLTEARRSTREAERILELAARATARERRLSELMLELAHLVGTVAAPEDLSEALAHAAQRAREDLDSNRRRRAELDGRINAARAQLAELTDATGACPVCRRPLDPADLTTARAAHESEIESWLTERDAITDDELEGRLAHISRAREQLVQLGPAQELPTTLPDVEAIRTAEATAAADYETAVKEVVFARATAHQATEAVSRAENEASALEAVTAAFARQATLEATLEALSDTRAALLKEGIEPLAESLDMHWSQLFRNRPGLSLAGDGGLTRPVGNAALTSSHFSDGERMVAQLLLRLLVLKATTRLPFMWIDEPLEHLDPDTRRALALLLTTAPSSDGGALRQVVMTTYEEPLVRRLRAAVHNTHIRYVAPAA